MSKKGGLLSRSTHWKSKTWMCRNFLVEKHAQDAHNGVETIIMAVKK
jgi:hypothetical protein